MPNNSSNSGGPESGAGSEVIPTHPGGFPVHCVPCALVHIVAFLRFGEGTLRVYAGHRYLLDRMVVVCFVSGAWVSGPRTRLKRGGRGFKSRCTHDHRRFEKRSGGNSWRTKRLERRWGPTEAVGRAARRPLNRKSL